MTNQAFRKAKALGEEAEETTAELARTAARKLHRAGGRAAEALEEAHEASKDYPHFTIALAAAVGFLLGVMASRR